MILNKISLCIMALSLSSGFIICADSSSDKPVSNQFPVVLLVGDSIRMGYAPLVKQKLANKAIVKWPEENCEDSGKILNNIGKYIEANKPDLIYINCGLHDIKSERGTDRKKIPLETYESNLNKIISLIKSKNIKILWASTTPVMEEAHNKIQSFDRLNKDIKQYNETANKVMLAQGIRVIDHYQVIEKADKQTVFKKDGVHYTGQGSEILSAAVSQEIIKSLTDFKRN
ncbi:MAG: GDSL-type esterase/lipase family protein [Victivallaceae bacterium]